jgi:hypothetical protein
MKRREKKRKAEDPPIYKTNILKELAKSSKVSLLTLQNIERGGKIQLYAKARAISEATGGKVKVEELCE